MQRSAPMGSKDPEDTVPCLELSRLQPPSVERKAREKFRQVQINACSGKPMSATTVW